MRVPEQGQRQRHDALTATDAVAVLVSTTTIWVSPEQTAVIVVSERRVPVISSYLIDKFAAVVVLSISDLLVSNHHPQTTLSRPS